ncbi:U-box domain-containing protein 33-like isoform X1 [Primulina huaijiensis]|uniref:U-box domain-containing protein 33-like isoform X1 n=1 Tax=Primulina huaijiensis TaxID=1492673 RepID=UPI003CC75561
MAVVELPLPTRRLRCSEIDITRMNLESVGRISGLGDIAEVETVAPPSAVVEEGVLFVALGKDVKEGGSVLTYAVDNCKGMKICVLHVHQPAQKIPMMGTTMPISLLEEEQVRAYHEDETQQMQKTLDKYIRACERVGARAEKLCIEMESPEKGIVQLIHDHGIKCLVMGAAANKFYSSKMTRPRSRKAIHVSREAPPFCQIWFVCKGNLIHNRESKLGGVIGEEYSPPFQASPNMEATPALRSVSVTERKKGRVNSWGSLLDYRRFKSVHHQKQPSALSSGSGGASLRSNPEGTIDSDSVSRSSPPVESCVSSSSSEINEDSPLVSFPNREGSVLGSEFPMFEHTNRDYRHSSAAPNSNAKTSTSPPLKEENMNDELHVKLEQFLAEAESSQREVSDESIRLKNAEKDAIDAIHRAKVSEAMYTKELRHRREIEENLARGRLEIEIIKRQLGEVSEELRSAQEQQSSLEHQNANSDKMVKELKGKMFSAVGLLQKYKTERDDLQVKLDHALRVAEELRKNQSEEASSSSVSQFFSEFSFSEIEEATDYFNQMTKIGEGGYGCIYKGKLRNTQVAIKMLHPDSLQGPLEFEQEVNILSKLRHPNIVTLIGACPETWALIYEYLPNGSLEDRLNCKNNTPPLKWQTRIRIATELCSALIFLHSCRPRGVIHGDLKPANILLDANFVSKLGDFGICRILPREELSGNNTLFCRTDPKGTLVYMDPEFLATGEITSKSDVYSFGIILLRLLTGRPGLGIVKEVQYALDQENLNNLLDSTAGDWPFVQAKQLAHLAISCADMNRKGRPDLYTEVWRVLEPMTVSSGASSFRVGSEEYSPIPSYFVCPIFQEIMQDPVVAADGFTYEAEALKGWLESGHDTSPMTNLKLPHNNVVPNHALRSAIQEWLHQH